jgi:hypothetical protein
MFLFLVQERDNLLQIKVCCQLISLKFNLYYDHVSEITNI